MLNQKAIGALNLYKILFWLLLVIVAGNYTVSSIIGRAADADELVIKKEVKGGGWVYVTRYGAPATDLDTLRFYISAPIPGGDQEILNQLNKRSPFMIADSGLKDVVISDTASGVEVELKGAVYSYYSKQYVEGEHFKSYRISLNQKDGLR